MSEEIKYITIEEFDSEMDKLTEIFNNNINDAHRTMGEKFNKLWAKVPDTIKTVIQEREREKMQDRMRNDMLRRGVQPDGLLVPHHLKKPFPTN